MRHAPLLVVTLLALIGCGDVQTTDPRFATPERTVATLPTVSTSRLRGSARRATRKLCQTSDESAPSTTTVLCAAVERWRRRSSQSS